MTIFYLNLNPVQSAIDLGDSMIEEQLQETVRTLASVYLMEQSSKKLPDFYSPCYELEAYADRSWVQKDLKNWLWVMMHAYGLCETYEKRFGLDHPLKDIVLWVSNPTNSPSRWVTHRTWSDPPRLSPKTSGDIIYDNRAAYYRGYKAHHIYQLSTMPKWLVRFYMKEEVQKLIDAAELDIVDPDKHRPNGLTDSTWEQIKFLAVEVVNGRRDVDD